jgi:hypothetical protein
VKTLLRWRLAAPLIGLTGLSFTLALLGAVNLWPSYTSTERTTTALLCLITGAGLALSISIGVDSRIREVPWLRIIAIAASFLLACGAALLRRSLVLDGV